AEHSVGRLAVLFAGRALPVLLARAAIGWLVRARRSGGRWRADVGARINCFFATAVLDRSKLSFRFESRGQVPSSREARASVRCAITATNDHWHPAAHAKSAGV